MARFRCFEDERHTICGRKTWYDMCTISHVEARKTKAMAKRSIVADARPAPVAASGDKLQLAEAEAARVLKMQMFMPAGLGAPVQYCTHVLYHSKSTTEIAAADPLAHQLLVLTLPPRKEAAETAGV